jgi:hypothetical protein
MVRITPGSICDPRSMHEQLARRRVEPHPASENARSRPYEPAWASLRPLCAHRCAQNPASKACLVINLTHNER